MRSVFYSFGGDVTDARRSHVHKWTPIQLGALDTIPASGISELVVPRRSGAGCVLSTSERLGKNARRELLSPSPQR